MNFGLGLALIVGVTYFGAIYWASRQQPQISISYKNTFIKTYPALVDKTTMWAAEFESNGRSISMLAPTQSQAVREAMAAIDTSV